MRTAQESAETAQSFGQQDDITVLTLALARDHLLSMRRQDDYSRASSRSNACKCGPRFQIDRARPRCALWLCVNRCESIWTSGFAGFDPFLFFEDSNPKPKPVRTHCNERRVQRLSSICSRLFQVVSPQTSEVTQESRKSKLRSALVLPFSRRFAPTCSTRLPAIK